MPLEFTVPTEEGSIKGVQDSAPNREAPLQHKASIEQSYPLAWSNNPSVADILAHLAKTKISSSPLGLRVYESDGSGYVAGWDTSDTDDDSDWDKDEWSSAVSEQSDSSMSDDEAEWSSAASHCSSSDDEGYEDAGSDDSDEEGDDEGEERVNRFCRLREFGVATRSSSRSPLMTKKVEQDL